MVNEIVEDGINELFRLLQKAASIDPVDSWERMKFVAMQERIRLKKQEFIEDNSKDETVMPEQQAAKKETVKSVSEDITASLAPTPPAPTTHSRR